MQAVMLSIRPEWCAKIASGKKTIELRKSKPKLELPFKCYIYCSLSGCKEFFIKNLGGDISRWNKEKWADKKGKVIGEFICDAMLSHCEMANADLAEQMSCVRREKIREYSGGKEVFGWHISDLEIYDTPKDLSDFYVEDIKTFDCPSLKRMKRPPQSWCYVEGLAG